MLLEEFLRPLERTQLDLARELGKTPAAINELVKGRRAVSPEMALLLADAFGTTPEFWLELQMQLDLWRARRRHRGRRGGAKHVKNARRDGST